MLVFVLFAERVLCACSRHRRETVYLAGAACVRAQTVRWCACATYCHFVRGNKEGEVTCHVFRRRQNFDELTF